MSNQLICQTNRCESPALWTMVTTGHPNGDVAACYCTEHVWVPASDLAARPFSITVEGPATLTAADMAAVRARAAEARQLLGGVR